MFVKLHYIPKKTVYFFGHTAVITECILKAILKIR